MSSTRKQKAKERRSRQLDMLSDVENVDMMLGSYSRDDEENTGSEKEVNLDSGSNRPHHSSNVIGEDFRSLLKTNSRENSEITIETSRMINEEISNQMSRKLNEIKSSLNIQIQDAISSAFTEKILSSIQNTLEMRERTNCTMVDRGSSGLQNSAKSANFTTGDRGSSGLQRNSKVKNSHKLWENRPRKCFIQENSRQMSRQSFSRLCSQRTKPRQSAPYLGLKISTRTSKCQVFSSTVPEKLKRWKELASRVHASSGPWRAKRGDPLETLISCKKFLMPKKSEREPFSLAWYRMLC